MEQAQKRCAGLPNVSFQEADAYTLEGVPGGFNAAFGHWWWSHVPKKNIPSFLTSLHSKLVPGAVVLFSDSLPEKDVYLEKDDAGDTYECRVLANGRMFKVIKNHPGEKEVKEALAAFAEDIRYRCLPAQQRWEVVYRVRGN